jgi:hypothetical protein
MGESDVLEDLDASNDSTGEIPLRPSARERKKASLPSPIELTTPRPVMKTRDKRRPYSVALSWPHHFHLIHRMVEPLWAPRNTLRVACDFTQQAYSFDALREGGSRRKTRRADARS